MSSEERKPVISENLNLPETKGTYNFFTKTVAKLFVIAMVILGKIKTATDAINKRDAETLVSCMWVVNHMARKLEGICSISSSVHDNVFCKARQKIVNCICAYCYAYTQQSYQTGLKEHNILNDIILRNVLLPVSAFKKLLIMFPYLRIESFGDVANVTQARNYLRIIKAFPRKRCAIWSKNIETWRKAFDAEGKPENTTFVLSSSFLNQPAKVELQKYPFIDHVFTVYTKTYAKKNNVTINCGGRRCMDCIRKKTNCYYRNTEFYINELKK